MVRQCVVLRVVAGDRDAGGWWAWPVAGSAGFVGRERELSRLHEAVVGDARLVLMIGDAGIGKTRFVAEGMRRADRSDEAPLAQHVGE